jgi:SEC-C motif domain protein
MTCLTAAVADGAPSGPARCPCGTGLPYDACCGPLHHGETVAPTAERLMRSRYAAFAVGDADYLLSTWHPSTRPKRLDLDRTVRWLGLDIVGRTGGAMLQSTGTVSFRARSSAGTLSETSRFVREGGRWYYVDGEP